jgi:hypothetical protein
MGTAATWIAPVATMIAAMMTAANLGVRITGWGFVVFAIGSVCWSIVGIVSHQPNLLVANAFLTLVNLIGIWRWLGRQAQYEKGGRKAAAKSINAASPDLLPVGQLAGAKLIGRDGEAIGEVIDAMMSRDGRLTYLVVSEGGLGGVGERLHAIDVNEVSFEEAGVACNFDEHALSRRQQLTSDTWPTRTWLGRAAGQGPPIGKA